MVSCMYATGMSFSTARHSTSRAVSRLLVAEFYGPSLWSPAQCLVELNRLQKNFHSYGEDASRHLMLLATSVDDGRLVGFVDIDGREKRPGQSELECTLPPMSLLLLWIVLLPSSSISMTLV